MKRLLALLMTLMLLAGLCACGSGNSGAASMDPATASSGGAANGTGDMEAGWVDESGQASGEAQAESQTDTSIYQDSKLIRRAQLQVQTETFDQAAQALEELVAQCGGYFERASVEGGSLRNQNANRYGNYTIRLPQDQFDAFLGKTGELGYVVSQSETSENVSQQYYDTQAHLKAQRTKQERLLALLEKADSMETIVALEDALSDVEYEIESLTTTLNQYDSLISFSTVELTLEEVGTITAVPGERDSLGQRMAAGIQSSFRGLINGGQGLLVWLAYNLVLVVIVVVIAAVAAVVVVRKKKGLPLWKRRGPKGPEDGPDA